MKNRTAIEVGGSSKAMYQGRRFIYEIKALIKEYGAGKVEVYLEDTGSAASRRAKKRTIGEIANALRGDRDQAERQVTTFGPSDKLCV